MSSLKEEKIREYHDALADILCWVDGYCAALGSNIAFERLNLGSLRDMKRELHSHIWGEEK